MNAAACWRIRSVDAEISIRKIKATSFIDYRRFSMPNNIISARLSAYADAEPPVHNATGQCKVCFCTELCYNIYICICIEFVLIHTSCQGMVVAMAMLWYRYLSTYTKAQFATCQFAT